MHAAPPPPAQTSHGAEPAGQNTVLSSSIPSASEAKKPENKKNPFAMPKKRGGFVPASHVKREKDISSHTAEEKPAMEQETQKPQVEKASVLDLNTRWNIELPLIPIHNMNSLVSGSHNRFAHAAAMFPPISPT